MTCIVAFVDKETQISYVGGERGASDDSMIWNMASPKVWRDKGYLFGFAGAFSIEKLKYNFDPPAPPSQATDEEMNAFMNTTFIEALSGVYEDMHIDKGENAGLIIVVGNRIFVHNSSDMSATMVASNFVADGSGSEYALGSLHTSEKWTDSRNRVRTSLEAAIKFSPSCAGHIDIISTEGWDWEKDL